MHVGNGRVAMHFGGGGQRSDSYQTPEGEVDNSQSRSGFANVGGGWTGERQYAGVSYGYDDTRYGVPVIEEGAITLTPRRHAFSARAGGQGLTGFLSSYRGTIGVRRYAHEELEGPEVNTRFENNTVELEGLLSHRPLSRFSGSFGGWLLDRKFSAEGEEALSPPVDQRAVAGFFYEELTWPHFTMQFGGRVDHTTFKPGGTLPDREFTEYSTSIGGLYRPQEASDNLVVAVSIARAARNPALEEMYFFGNHAGNLTFEIGNPDLNSEKALGFDVSVRGRSSRLQTSITFFRNRVDDFIFRNPLSDEEFAARADEFAARFGIDPDDLPEGEFPYVEFIGTDATMWGAEAHADITLTERFGTELTYDFVRGSRDVDGEPLPRIPPQRLTAGLRYTQGPLQVGGSVTAAGKQDRVYGDETETAAYGLLRLYATYSLQTTRSVQTVTARLDNATNTLYRNHLNFIKDLVPEMGRAFRLVYSVRF